jgi:hypothetical protein
MSHTTPLARTGVNNWNTIYAKESYGLRIYTGLLVLDHAYHLDSTQLLVLLDTPFGDCSYLIISVNT